jgi:hypothetical protein
MPLPSLRGSRLSLLVKTQLKKWPEFRHSIERKPGCFGSIRVALRWRLNAAKMTACGLSALVSVPSFAAERRWISSLSPDDIGGSSCGGNVLAAAGFIPPLLWVCLYRVWPARPRCLGHRGAFRTYWRWRSRWARRPKMSAEFRALIGRTSGANPLGRPGVHGKLLKPGRECLDHVIIFNETHLCGCPCHKAAPSAVNLPQCPTIASMTGNKPL